MRMIKRVLATLLALALLACVPVAVTAEETAAAQEIFATEVLHSITTEETTGNGLAFLFETNVVGATMDASHVANYDNATVTVNGVKYPVVTMGAIMANQAKDIANINNLTLGDVDDNFILNVEAKKLSYINEDENTCSFAVRIIRLPEGVQGFAIAARPYIVLKNGDEEITYYGASNMSTYNQVYYTNEPDETPVLDLSALSNVDERLSASATAEYAAICPITYREGFKVSLTLSNVSANAKTSAGDYVTYALKDAEGNVLDTVSADVDVLLAGESKVVEFYAPIDTATIEATETDLDYVPDVELPAIGSDIDVTKKKNRIRVSAASASFNEDGTIHVSLTFKNYTTNWITEETDYVKYAYYKGDQRKGMATLYIGCIDTKKHPVKTFEFDVPAYATKVELVSSKIVYWTEWA